MTLDVLLTQLAREISGVRAKDDVARIAAHHRIQSSPGLLDAMHVVQGGLSEAGIDATLHRYPADGVSGVFTWTSPPFWTVRSGSLETIAPEARVVARFDEISQTVVAHSPGGSAEGELVHVEDGTRDEHYEGIDVRGRFVLSRGTARHVASQAGARGAAGVIFYPSPQRAAASHDLVQYLGLFPAADRFDRLPMCFSVSLAVASRWLRQMEREAVHIAARIDAELGAGPLPVLEAVVRGRDEGLREVLLVAHLCHPRQSANDNASGAGVLLEVARALHRLAQGEMPLRRTVRFLWVPEFYGTLFWADAHRDTLSRTLLCLNLDMVGQSPESIGRPLELSRVPSSVAGTVNAWLRPMADRVGDDPATASPHGTSRRLHAIVTPPCGGSDHLVFNDAPFHLPSVMFGHEDPFWHTDLDLMENVCPTELRRVGILAAALAAVPDLVADELPRLTSWLLRYGIEELTRAKETAVVGPPECARALVDLALSTERRRAERFAALAAEAETAWDPSGHVCALEAAHAGLVETLPPAAPRDRGPQPRRCAEGPISRGAIDALPPEDREFLDATFSGHHRIPLEEIANLCDGTRDPEDLVCHLALDFGRWFDPEEVSRGLALLAAAGYLEG